ncbi:aromatic ring-hydroxylating dioxygenase subunit alpha (plasmid) [Aliisedimentitalea scapharcae]|uniref:Aromatic ring-hydroxylating dioxygenase subunit alpha n=1 Tax=Aliisedimentitalea scapharcae TaxID=1524259 RepID=A0ABZ2Y019_9RHOB|nr:aromatic ring-hydroxylating dioxygenase subunit alpha [Rhodobacteraceae bacterium M382]
MQNDLTGSDGFIRNCWYVAGRSEDFGQSLTANRFLGDDVVIFRGESGEPIALEDACPHRKLPLSRGSIQGSTVVCGYHGLTFDCSGACVAAPTQENAIPKRATVRSYPVEDRWGFLWIWMGDEETADPGEIIDIPNFDNPQWGRTERGSMGMACNYLYITDNLLDPSHVAWVHLTSFAGAGTDNRPLEMEESDDHVTIFRWIHSEPAAPYYASMLTFGDNCDRKQHYECRVPSTAINMSVYAPAGQGGADRPLSDEAFVNISYNFITPVDHENSLYFWFQHRNRHAGVAEIDKHMFEGAIMAFTEDKEVLEEVQRGMANRKSAYLNLGLDAGAMRFRQKVARRIQAEQPSD